MTAPITTAKQPRLNQGYRFVQPSPVFVLQGAWEPDIRIPAPVTPLPSTPLRHVTPGQVTIPYRPAILVHRKPNPWHCHLRTPPCSAGVAAKRQAWWFCAKTTPTRGNHPSAASLTGISTAQFAAPNAQKVTKHE
jgi:hypothetical protein